MKTEDLQTAAITVVVLAILSWYYFIFLGFPVNLNFLNSIVAFSATFLISIAFFLGPISRFFPYCRQYLDLRKPVGLVGYAFAALHTLLVVFVLLEESSEVTFSEVASIGFAAVAFVVFTLMALTSTPKWIEKLGYQNWKSLQRTGYLALIFVIFHVVLLEQGVFLSRTIGQVAVIAVLGILLLRIFALILRKKAQKKDIM